MFSGIKSILRTKKYSFDTSDLNNVYLTERWDVIQLLCDFPTFDVKTHVFLHDLWFTSFRIRMYSVIMLFFSAPLPYNSKLDRTMKKFVCLLIDYISCLYII